MRSNPSLASVAHGRGRSFFLAVGASWAAACGGGGRAPAPSADPNAPLPNPLPAVVGRVNDQAIYLRSIIPLAKPALEKAQDREKAKPAALRAALQTYVDRELLFQEAQARGLRVADKDVEYGYNQARLAHPDEAEWEETLKLQGFDPASFRTELRIQALVAKLAEQEAEKLGGVSDQEARARYEGHSEEFRRDRVRVRHLLVRTLPLGTAQHRGGQRAKAESLLFRARRGEPLASLAKESSDDAASRDEGGELPAFGRGQAAPGFEAAAFALKPGEISELVETPAGFHILELIERIPGGTPPFESVEVELKQRLLANKRERAIQALEEALRARARIELYL